jgi:hypothetical protein
MQLAKALTATADDLHPNPSPIAMGEGLVDA